MIRNEAEYQEALQRLSDERARMASYKNQLQEEGLTAPQLKRALDPMRSFHLQLEEEVHQYERLKRGDFAPVVNFKGLGQTLIGLRIARGLTQKGLATLLGVHETQVSRDERNEYHGITVERAAKVIEVMGAVLTTSVESTIALVEPVGGGTVRVRRVAKKRKVGARKAAPKSHSTRH